MNKLNFSFIVLLSVLFLASCNNDDPTPAPKVPALSFSKTRIEVAVGKSDSAMIVTGTSPVTQVVADATIATSTLSKNYIVVKGIKAGTTLITVTDKNKQTGKITVITK